MLLAASHAQTAEQPVSRPIFTPPFGELSADALLRHFQTRTAVHYFPVPDREETTHLKISAILENRFEFNGERHQLPASIPWLTNPSHDREWLILLHKFYYAVGLGMAFHETDDPRYAEQWVALTDSWIQTVTLDFLPSDVAGRRIQNWIFAHYYFVSTRQPHCVTAEFYRSFLQSLHRQVSYLRDHVTPARNHRTLELCALFLAAVVFPEFAESAEWLAWSTAELLHNLQSDLQPDGVHCEQSTDYHHLVLKNYLWVTRLARLNRVRLPDEFDALIKKALEFSLYAHRPDGLIPALSDGDSRCFLDLLQQGHDLYGGEDLLYVASQGAAGQRPAHRAKAFPHAGYYVLRSGWGEHQEAYHDERYLIFDCGPLGAGNHGHLDLLSFEAYAYGTPLVVDPGRYTYDESGPVNWRASFRGTAAHNTVLVDERNQTRYELRKNRFKISGPEPDRTMAVFRSEPGLDYLHGIAESHEYPVIHERTIVFVNGEYWVVLDRLSAEEPHRYDLLFHLTPMAQDQVSMALSPNTLIINSPQLLLAQPIDPAIVPSIRQGYISRSYGTKQSAPILQLTQHNASACFVTVLHPYKETRPTLSVEISDAGRMWEGSLIGTPVMIQISIAHDEHRFCDDLWFSGRTGQAIEAPGASAAPHVRVSRTCPGGQRVFEYEV